MTAKSPPDPVPELRPCEVQAILGIGRTTLHDHAAAGRLQSRRTPGGHRRYPAAQPLITEALQARGGAR